MTQGIKWLASYPKSGNTWARLFLLNYHLAPDEPLHPNKLGETLFAPADDAEWLIDAATGMPPDKMLPLSFIKLRTAFQRHYRLRCHLNKVVPYMKTHSPNLVAYKAHAMIDWDITESACYFVRDPRNVLPSFAAHTNHGFDKMAELMADPNYGVKRPIGTLSPLGDWSAHVTSWEKQATVIRYEDLPGGFEAMLETFGLPRDERFEKAVKFTDIDTLSAIEDKDGFAEASQHTKFFGGKRRKPNKTQITKIEADHGEVMERYGYPLSSKEEIAA